MNFTFTGAGSPRPGLAIQAARGSGLCPRLAFIESQQPEMLRPERRMELLAQVAEV